MDTKAQKKAVLQLAKHLRSNCDKILDKSIPFVVDSALLWLISEAIRTVLSKEATLFTDEKNPFEDYVLFLADFFEQTPSLCISLTESVKGISSIPGNLDLANFRSLHFLELRKVPPHMVIGISGIKRNLRKLKCSRCLDSINEILSPQHPRGGGSGSNNNNNNINNQQEPLPIVAPSSLNLVWPELKDIDLSFNRISEVDCYVTANFQLTPSIETLNLSRNRIFSIHDSFSRVLTSLRVLNLNYNQLKRIPAVPPTVKTLLLSHNYITSLTSGAFKSLKSVEVLDLSTNMISDENEFDSMNQLSHLKSLSLLGNPVSFLENYRHSLCSNLNRLVLNRTFLLDNKKLSVSEVRRALEAMKYHKFVPFTVEDDETDASSRMTTSTPSLKINNMKSLTQSYDSTSSSIRSSCRKKAKIREPHVFDPDEDEELLAERDDVSVKTLGRAQSRESGGDKDRNCDKDRTSEDSSDSSEIAVLTRNAIEQLREKYGPENWLLKQAGVEVSKLFKIPVAIPVSKPAASSAPLSQSLPNTRSMGGSFYTTATEFEESEGTVGKENSSSSATISPMLDDDNVSNNAITDDSLVYYPCDSGPTEEAAISSTTKAQTDNQYLTKQGFPTYVPEVFKDPEGYAIQFHYFQGGNKFKLVILENYLYEVDKETSEVIYKWDLRSLETLADEKFMKETDTVEFRITFDTMKKSMRERTFVMTEKDYTKFYETVEPFLELKILQDFADAFQCLKCNAQFSKAMADKTVTSDADGAVKEIAICNNPDCRSEMLVLLDSAPLPNNKSLNMEKELEQFGGDTRGSSPFAGGSSSVAKPVQDSKLFRVPLASSTPKLDTDGFPNNNPSQWDFSECRASAGGVGLATTTSPEPKSSSEPTSLNATTNTKSDSDIETLSCNSSSIEVIGHSGGDSGSNSDIVDVPEAVELSSDGQMKSKSTALAMTDSTSSGSCAESVCTTYEKRAAAAGGNGNSPSKISNANSSFSTSGSSTLTLTAFSPLQNSPGLGYVPVRYDYEDFSKVDHRLQLFCEISVFQKSDERLLALAKVLVISDAPPYSALVIFSNKKMYIYKIIGLEGDKPDNWLQKVRSFSLEKLTCLNVLIGRHGIGVEMQNKGYYALVFRDSQKTSSFLECFLGDICGEMESPPLVRDFSQTHKALLSTDEVAYFGVLQYASCENEKTHTSAVVVTTTEVLFITDLTWLGATRQGNVVTSKSRKLTSLRQVESHANNENFVKLIFGSANHVFWELYFDSVNEKQLFVTNLNLYTKGVPFISLYQPIEP